MSCEQPRFEHRHGHVDLDAIEQPVATEYLREPLLLKLDFRRDLGIRIDEQEDRRVPGFGELRSLEEGRGKGRLATDPDDPKPYSRTENARHPRLDECLVAIALDKERQLERCYGFASSHRWYV
jgi:hypothetical protein